MCIVPVVVGNKFIFFQKLVFLLKDRKLIRLTVLEKYLRLKKEASYCAVELGGVWPPSGILTFNPFQSAALQFYFLNVSNNFTCKLYVR